MHGSQALSQYWPSISSLLGASCREALYVGDIVTPCHDFILQLIDIVFNLIHPVHRPDPLRSLPKLLGFDKMPKLSKVHFPNGLCNDCKETLCKAIANKRGRVWEKLPQ